MPVESIDNKVEIEFLCLFISFSPNSFFCVFYKKYSSVKDWKKSSSFNSDNSEAFPWAEHVAVFPERIPG